MYAKMRSENNISKNALSQNINLAFHEIAQITAGEELAGAALYEVEVREEETRFENDIVVRKRDLYEVKPMWSLGTTSGRNEAEKQLKKYITNSREPLEIGEVPDNLGKDMQGVYLFTLGDIKVYEKYAGSTFAGTPNNLPGMVGYYLTLKSKDDDNRKEEVRKQPSQLAQPAAQHFNNAYYSYQIQQNQQKTFEVQLRLSLSAITFQLQISTLSATVFPAWYQMGIRTPGSLLQHNLIYFPQYTACGLMNAA